MGPDDVIELAFSMPGWVRVLCALAVEVPFLALSEWWVGRISDSSRSTPQRLGLSVDLPGRD